MTARLMLLVCLVTIPRTSTGEPTPVARDDVAFTYANVSLPIDVLRNDEGAWISGTFTQPGHGLVAVIDHSLWYAPDADFLGTDEFFYTLTDVAGTRRTASVAIEVSDAADATLPGFTCGAIDRFCNMVQTSGLGAAFGYGRGAAFSDVDGDGWDDLFVADPDARLAPRPFGLSEFYVNNRDGSFRRIDWGLREVDLFATWAGSLADYDNDGDPDLLLANGGYSAESSIAFYENRVQETGRFVVATDEAGFGVANGGASRWWGVSWADFDNDGFLDVVISRTAGRPLLFRNDGSRRFDEVGQALGVDVDFSSSDDGKNPVWLDYDDDGDADLYVAGLRRHALYENRGGSQFVNVTSHVFRGAVASNVHFSASHPAVFAAAAEDFNQDGLDDLYLGRWNEQDVVFINDGHGGLQAFGRSAGLDMRTGSGVALSQPYENTMGLGVGDLFNDGFPDVLIGTGDPARADQDILYCNEGAGFTRCTERLLSGADGRYRTRTHAAIFSDIDHDGDTDAFLNLGGHPVWDAENSGRDTREFNALFVQRSETGRHTATITLEGTRSNRDSIGARIEVRDGAVAHYYRVRSTQGFQSQNSNAVVVNLAETGLGYVRVRWPSGGVRHFIIRAGERLHVVEPRLAAPEW